MSFEAAHKPLEVGPANDIAPAFRLDVNDIKTQPVLLDDSIDSAIATLPDRLTGVNARAAIAHGNQ